MCEETPRAKILRQHVEAATDDPDGGECSGVEQMLETLRPNERKVIERLRQKGQHKDRSS